MSEADTSPRKPFFRCEDCGNEEPVPMGEQFVNPRFRDCGECGAQGLEVVR